MINKNKKSLLPKLIVLLAFGFLLFSISRLYAAFTPPTVAPPGGNVGAPIYSDQESQTLSGSLTVSTPNNTPILGQLTAGGAGSYALYGQAADSADYAGYFNGGRGLGIAPNTDISFVQRGSGVSWPRLSDGADLYGIYVDSGGKLQLRGHGDGISFTDQNTNALLTITESGSVGIATSTPGYKLDLQGGQINASGGLCINGDCKTAWSQVVSGQWVTSGNNIYYSAGNVGINQANPSEKFHITGGSILLDTSDTRLKWGTGSSAFIQGNTSANVLTLGTNNIANFTIDATGNVSVANGEVRAKWLHATASGDNTIAGDLSVSGVTSGGCYNAEISGSPSQLALNSSYIGKLCGDGNGCAMRMITRGTNGVLWLQETDLKYYDANTWVSLPFRDVQSGMGNYIGNDNNGSLDIIAFYPSTTLYCSIDDGGNQLYDWNLKSFGNVSSCKISICN